tara:strand:+ start:303 stop:581 length:279 start_codon:yes stop_codon:yes gene_type:complete
MLRYNIRYLSSALKYTYFDYKTTITDVIDINLPQKTNLLKDKKNKPFIAEFVGSICKECFGSGWITDTKCELNYISNFKFKICKKCNGRGFI